jgi:DNA-binding MarR family transcriptional regulator
VTQPSLADETQELSAALTVYAGRLVRAVSRRTSPGVPAATLRLLSLLEELGPVGVSHLADADRCSQPTMSTAVRNLTEKGWAVKRANPADARSSLVALTDEGLSVLAEARRRNAAVVAARLEADPRHTVADLADAVGLLRHLLEDHPDESREDL